MSTSKIDPYSSVQAGTWSSFYSDQRSAKGLLYQARLRLTLELIDAYGGQGHGRALDVGCGAGQLTVALVRRGLGVTAVDFSLNMLELVAQHLQDENLPTDRVKLVNTDLNSCEFAAGEHDLICALGCLEFLREFADAVKRISRTLRPGGLFVLSMPNLYSPLVWPERLARVLVNLLHPGRAPACHAPVTYRTARRIMRANALTPLDVRFSFPATLLGERSFPPLSLIRRMNSLRAYRLDSCLANTWVAAFRKVDRTPD